MGMCSPGATSPTMKTGSTGDTATSPHAKVRDSSQFMVLFLALSLSLSSFMSLGPKTNQFHILICHNSFYGCLHDYYHL